MKLNILCTAAGIRCPDSLGEREIASITTDSRTAEKGSLFIAVPGLHRNGNDFLPEAVARGAGCVLVQTGSTLPALPNGVAILTCDDPRTASAYLYDAWYGYPSRRMRFIGVTGTNGKTSTTFFLRAIFTSALHKCGLIGTVGYETTTERIRADGRDPLANMTTPDPPELYRVLSRMADDGVEYVIMEVSSHALALGKVAPLYFDAAVFTNLTPEHLDFHKTMDVYADAKAKLFAQCRVAVINADSPYAGRMKAACTGKTVTCTAKGAEADFRADNARCDPDGVTYTASSGNAHFTVRCPVPGEFTVMNSLEAAATARTLGIAPDVIKDALASVGRVKGRMERVKLGIHADFTVIIDYAHTPDALEKLLRTVNQLKKDGEKTVLLFGCGGDRDRGKRPVMGAIAAKYADAVIVTSDNSRSEEPADIIREILSGIPEEESAKITVIEDRERAIRYAVNTARAGDILLLAGKGHEEYEIGKHGRTPFSERRVVTEAFEEKIRQRPETTDGRTKKGGAT